MDNKYLTLTEAIKYAATLLDEGDLWMDNSGTSWDDFNLLDVAAADETETDDDVYYCVGFNGNIGLTQDSGYNVEWLYKVVPSSLRRQEAYIRRNNLVAKGYRLPKEVADSFSAACKRRGESQTSVLTRLMQGYIDE